MPTAPDRLPAEEIVNNIFSCLDVGKIFVRTFRFLSSDSVQFLRIHGSDEETIYEIQNSLAYKRAKSSLEMILDSISKTPNSSPGKRSTAVFLPIDCSELIQRELRSCLVTARDEDIFPVLLALLHLLENCFTDDLCLAFSNATDNDGVFQIDGSTAIPKPLSWPIAVNGSHRAPISGLPVDYIVLDQHLQLLTSPVEGSYSKPFPGLFYHPRSYSVIRPVEKELRIAFVNILTDISELDLQHNDQRFWIESLSIQTKQRVQERLKSAVEILYKEKVHLYILPELNLDLDSAKFIKKAWKSVAPPHAETPVGIAGRMHFPQNEEKTQFWNCPIVLAKGGEFAWAYSKKDPVIIRHPNKEHRTLTEALGDSKDFIVAMDTIIGRMCIVICKDFLNLHIRQAIAATRSSVILVLAMTNANSIEKFKTFAQEMASATSATTVFCNSTVLLKGHEVEDEKILGFVHPGRAVSKKMIPQHLLPENAGCIVTIYTFRVDSTAPEINQFAIPKD